MTTATKLVILGSGVGVVIVLAIRRWARGAPIAVSEAAPRPDDLGVGPDEAALADDAAAAPRGLFDVDPAPLAHVTEAMDPDANRAAHTAVSEQRARLPVRGKNLL